MLVVLFAAIACATYPDYYNEDYYVQNGLGKKIKKAAKKVTHAVTKPVKKVAHVVTHTVSSTTRSISRFVHHSSSSAWANPVKINEVSKNGRNANYEGDVYNIANRIAADFGIDAGSVVNFLNTAQNVVRLGGKSKRIFSNFAMNILGDKRYRTARVKAGVLTAYQTDSGIGCSVGYVEGNANIFADTTRKSSSSTLGFGHSSSSSDWRPLEPAELNDIYSTLESEIAGDLNAIKSQ